MPLHSATANKESAHKQSENKEELLLEWSECFRREKKKWLLNWLRWAFCVKWNVVLCHCQLTVVFFFQDCLGEFDLAFYHGVCCRRRKWGVFHECSSTYNQRPTEILCSLALMGMGNEHRREDWLQWPSNFLSRSPLEFHGFSNATLYLFCFLLLARYHQFALALASIVCGSKKWRKKKMRGLIHKGSGDKHDIYRNNAMRMSIWISNEVKKSRIIAVCSTIKWNYTLPCIVQFACSS